MKGRIPEELYADIVDNIPIVCVDLVIYYGHRVLLVKRKQEPLRGEWFFPGGRVLRNEKLKDAVHRKAMEELNLSVSIKRQIGVYEFFFDKHSCSPTGSHVISIAYLVQPVGIPEIKVDDTSYDYKWTAKIEHPLLKQILFDCDLILRGD